jgi:hypothetical protein
MLRKLIVLAITSGLAKKAYDHYQESRATAAGAKGRKVAARKPAAKSRATAAGKPKA